MYVDMYIKCFNNDRIENHCHAIPCLICFVTTEEGLLGLKCLVAKTKNLTMWITLKMSPLFHFS